MDIVGILLLYWYGGIATRWIDEPTRPPPMAYVSDAEDSTAALERAWLATEHNEHVARRRSRCGLALVVTGFALQAWAQW